MSRQLKQLTNSVHSYQKYKEILTSLRPEDAIQDDDEKTDLENHKMGE